QSPRGEPRSQHVNPRPASRPRLTARELQILQGMSCGHSNAEIGRKLYLAENTIKSHARSLFKKLAARDRAHAVGIGYRSGLLERADTTQSTRDHPGA
ncbi:response regulator transcription factor, partial [Streptomyces nanshensis]